MKRPHATRVRKGISGAARQLGLKEPDMDSYTAKARALVGMLGNRA